MKIGGAIFAGLILMLLLSECSKDKGNTSACQTCPTISFKTDIIPIFKSNCALSGCHLNYPGRVSLDSAVAYAQITAPGRGYVVAGSPNASILYLQMIPGGSPIMPPTGQLDACTSHKIYCWILQGALNN